MTPRWVSLLVVTMALVGGALAWVDAPLILRAVPTVLLVVYLPGLALANVLLPGAIIGRSERVVVAIGLSLIVVVAAGLIFNVSIGLSREAFIVTLVAVAVVGSLIAILRAPQKFAGTRPPSTRRVPVYSMILLGLASFLVVAALTVAALAQTNQPAAQFTELWALPRANFEQVEVGIRNLESGERTYRLEIRTGQRLVSEWADILLPVAQTWTQTIDVAAIGELEGDLTILLYESANLAEPYREAVVRRAVLDGS